MRMAPALLDMGLADPVFAQEANNMPKRYRFALLAGALSLFAAPALADGYPDRPVQRGPAPLTAQAPSQPHPECELIGGADWYCPPATRRYIDESKTRHYVRRYTTGGKCCGTAPPPVRQVSAPQGLTIDVTGFNGGVGAGVNGGYYGGGGTVIAYARASSSARAFVSASAATRFRGGFTYGGGGGCNVCGGS